MQSVFHEDNSSSKNACLCYHNEVKSLSIGSESNVEEKNAYQVLLYYKFVPIEDPEEFAKEHLALCNRLQLKGRILVAPEGINGTVSGLKEHTTEYMKIMHAHPLFQDMVFKIDEHHQHAFKKMHVRPKKELVTFRVENMDPTKKTGKYLSPKEFYELLQQDDVLVLDGRNNYEYDLGHFRGAIRPDVNSFREFPNGFEKT